MGNAALRQADATRQPGIRPGGNDEWADVDRTTAEKPNTPLIRNIGRHSEPK